MMLHNPDLERNQARQKQHGLFSVKNIAAIVNTVEQLVLITLQNLNYL